MDQGASKSASSSTTMSLSNQGKLKKFLELPYLLVELVFEFLNEKQRLHLFWALLGSEVPLQVNSEPARYGAVMAMQELFLQYVLDAELAKAELVLKIARLNLSIVSGEIYIFRFRNVECLNVLVSKELPCADQLLWQRPSLSSAQFL